MKGGLGIWIPRMTKHRRIFRIIWQRPVLKGWEARPEFSRERKREEADAAMTSPSLQLQSSAQWR